MLRPPASGSLSHRPPISNVASTLRGLVRAEKLPGDEATRALGLLGSVSLKRYGHVALPPRIWELRHNMWPYDAAYGRWPST